MVDIFLPDILRSCPKELQNTLLQNQLRQRKRSIA